MAAAEENPWSRKCCVVKRKCEEMEETSEALCWKLVKIKKLIASAEAEKRYLLQRLESYETLELQEKEEEETTTTLSPLSLVTEPLTSLDETPLPPPLIKHAPSKPRKSDPLSRKKADIDPAAPRKPQNAFLRFFQEHKDAYASQTEGEGLAKHHEVTKALAKVWGEAKPEIKKRYYDMYNEDKMRYLKEREEYQKTCQTNT